MTVNIGVPFRRWSTAIITLKYTCNLRKKIGKFEKGNAEERSVCSRWQ